MKITYKYRIGQKVQLVSAHLRDDFRRQDEFIELIGQEVTIISRGFLIEDLTHHSRQDVDKIKLEMFYYIAEDIYIKKDNFSRLTKIPETCLSGVGVWEEVDEQFNSVDGVEIVPFETRIYDKVIEKHKDEENKIQVEANCDFVFATEGTCVGLRKNYEIDYRVIEDNRDEKDIKISREFLTDFEPDEKHDNKPHPRQDAAAYGYESWHVLCTDQSLGSVYCNIPEDFAEIYVNTIIHSEWLKKIKFNPFYDVNFKWEIEQWLTRYGVYDKVKELWEQAKPGANEAEEKKFKEHEKFLKEAKKFLRKLNSEQIDELKRMLL